MYKLSEIAVDMAMFQGEFSNFLPSLVLGVEAWEELPEPEKP